MSDSENNAFEKKSLKVKSGIFFLYFGDLEAAEQTEKLMLMW